MIKVALGGMSAVLAEALGDMMGIEPDIEVVHWTLEAETALVAARERHADVLIVQGHPTPGPLAGLIEGEPLGLVLIDRDGHAGAAARITADARRIDKISREALIEAVRAVSARDDR